MPFFDMPISELHRYRPEITEPTDFDEFWSETLSEARSTGGQTVITPIYTGLVTVDVFDVSFPGFGGDRVAAWLTVPAGATAPLPAIVAFNGYGGGRGLGHERLTWAAAGYAHLFMDTRGQGSGWGSGGSTPDAVGSAPAGAGFMTRGILDPRGYYYRRLITDAVLAVDATRALDLVDPARVSAAGVSQGGGLALAVAGLVPDLFAVMPDVPFLCNFERAIGLTGNEPYAEIAAYLAVHRNAVDAVYRTLSYVDGVSFAKRAKAPALFSTALMDQTCPPSTVFAAANWYGGDVETTVYPFNGHEGGDGYRWPEQVQWLTALSAHVSLPEE